MLLLPTLASTTGVQLPLDLDLSCTLMLCNASQFKWHSSVQCNAVQGSTIHSVHQCITTISTVKFISDNGSATTAIIGHLFQYSEGFTTAYSYLFTKPKSSHIILILLSYISFALLRILILLSLSQSGLFRILILLSLILFGILRILILPSLVPLCLFRILILLSFIKFRLFRILILLSLILFGILRILIQLSL